MPDRFQPDQIITTLDGHDVDYVVIGGFAAVAHGSPRATFDLDIVAGQDPANLRRLAGALSELNARTAGTDGDLLDVDPTNADDLAAGASRTMSTDHGRLDVMAVDMVPGAPDYTELRSNAAVVTTPAGNRIAVAGLAHLLAMKRSSGRDKDLNDIAAILRVREIEAERPEANDPDLPGSPVPADSAEPLTDSEQAPKCGAWMPLARRRCGLSPGHRGQHR